MQANFVNPPKNKYNKKDSLLFKEIFGLFQREILHYNSFKEGPFSMYNIYLFFKIDIKMQ